MIKHHGDPKRVIAELKNDRNNAVAYIYPLSELPLISESAQLAGAVLTIKDNFATKNAPMQASSKILEHFHPKYDAEVVRRINANGGLIVAKTHGDEFGMGGTGEFSAYGLITNPLDHKRMVGGSSSGAAATFNRHLTYAIGSDTGDSVRLPASYVGTYGFKPSYGAISRYGLTAFATSLDTVGFFAHNVSDIITLSQVLYGEDPKDFSSRGQDKVELPHREKIPPKVVGMLENTELLSPTILRRYNRLEAKLKKHNINVIKFRMDPALLDAINEVYMIISFSEASSNLANYSGISFGNAKKGHDWQEIMIKTRAEGFGKMVQRRLTLGAFYLLEENQKDLFERAQKIRRLINNAFNKIYEKCDLLMFPAAPAAPLLSEGKADTWINSYLAHANFNGSPSIVMKWTQDDNKMPVGLALDSKIYSDAKLLAYAHYLEEMLQGDHE